MSMERDLTDNLVNYLNYWTQIKFGKAVQK
jgi:hypothetical protein